MPWAAWLLIAIAVGGFGYVWIELRRRDTRSAETQAETEREEGGPFDAD